MKGKKTIKLNLVHFLKDVFVEFGFHGAVSAEVFGKYSIIHC